MEAERWKVSCENLKNDLRDLTGNILLASANIAYLGPFNSQYRDDMLAEWVAECIK